MIKVGYIDYYLDEWHALKAPEHFLSVAGDEVKVCYAYGEITAPNGTTSEQFCEKMGIECCATIAEVIEKSDVLMVLAPDNCERKEDLAYEALISGKPTFIDKPFGTDLASAKRMFELADKYNTPCYSCSALRFAEEYKTVDTDKVESILAVTPQNSFDNYILHALEPAMMLMGKPAVRAMCVKKDTAYYSAIFELESGRIITVNAFDYNVPYRMTLSIPSDNQIIECSYSFWKYHYKAMVQFFKTGVPAVSHKETLMIAAAREAAKKSMESNGEWIAVDNNY